MNDGGLWWNEDEKNFQGNGNSNKPTCANGDAALESLGLISIYKNER